MDSLRLFSLVGLLVYFGVLLFVVLRDKRQKNVLEYFFAGRSLPFWALSITFIASWWGAGSAISTADLAYTDGLSAFWYYGVPVLMSTLLMIVLAKVIRGVNYLTQGEMMSARYNRTVGNAVSIMIFLFMTVTAASQMVGIGTFFGTYLGLGYEFAVIAGTLIVLVYSMFGGFRGVVVTDIVQFVLLLISAIAVFVVALVKAGGFGEIARAAESLGKVGYMSITAGAGQYIAYVITFGCAWMIQANVWQRISAARNTGDARRMTVMSFFAYIPLYLIVVFTGMAGLVLYQQLPEGGIVPAIILDYMNPILGSLVFIGISAAIMSTMDSLINTGAMTLAVDLYKPDDERKKLQFSRIATGLVTLIAIVIALRIRSILEVSWIASDIITTGVFVPLVAGFFWKRGTSAGALAAIGAGFVFCVYNLLRSLDIPLPAAWEAQSTVQVVIGVGLSAVVYVVVSLCTKPEGKELVVQGE